MRRFTDTDIRNLLEELKKIYPNKFLVESLSNAYENRVNSYLELKEKYDKLLESVNLKSPFEMLPQYALSRDDFINIYGNVSEVLMNENPYETSNFKGWYNDDEWYILHKSSGTMINWYKHCGRTNTCNKILTIEQHKEFAKMILEDMKENDVGVE